MKQFRIEYALKGAAGTTRAPNTPPVVDAESIQEVLTQLAERLPFKDSALITVVGVYIQEVMDG